MFLIHSLIIEAVGAREIGFVEDFALADNRMDTLKQLVPGSSEYYYYHCLTAQQNRDFERVNELVDQWIKRDGYTRDVKEILNRQALLEYDLHPTRSIKHIKRELDLHFDHQKAAAHRQADYPSVLDQNLISTPVLMQNGLANHKNLEGIEDAGLDFLDHQRLEPDRRRDLLSRLTLPDIPNLPELVIADLKTKHSGGFGSHNIHSRMTKSQLEECLRLAPELIEVSGFVHAYLTRLAPSDDTDINYDMAEKKAYLDRMWRFVMNLPPAHNSLKAHVLYHLLDYHRSLGNYDAREVKQLFMAYLEIPRKVAYINPDFARNASNLNVLAVLTTEFGEHTLLPKVGNDKELVRSFLAHYFKTERCYKEYAKYVRDDYLQVLFAETKIVNGIGDMEQWYSMMPPELHQKLKDRVDLDFGATNKRFYTADEQVTLDLFVKNIKTLIVKVFEINTFNYYRANYKPINTAIELDGLVATHEKVVTYDEPPVRRRLHTFKFPGIGKPGVYVIEFIGNGKSSRAVIQKGNLYYLGQVGPAGHEFTIYDDSNQTRPNGSIHLAGRQFKPDESGVIIIPFTEKPGRQDIIIKDGDQCTLSHFNHESENYKFTAGFYVDRESLIKRMKARALIRPMLSVNGTPISLTLLEQVRLTIESTNTDGVSSTKEIADFELYEDKESKIEFQVPERLQSIRFILRAGIKNISRNKKEDLTAQAQFNVNSIDTTLLVEDFHLSHQEDGYVLDLLGKNGEGKPDRQVNIELKHRCFIETVRTTLQTDDLGRVHLGKLEGIQWLRAEGLQGDSRTWHLTGDAYQYPAILHARSEEPLRIPYVEPAKGQGRMHYGLFEKRGNSFYQDVTDAVIVKDGFLTVQGLAAGNYELHLKDRNVLVQLRLTRGKETDAHIMSEKRVLEVHNPHPLHISKVDIKQDELVVQLANTTDAARLHLIATRFVPAHHPFVHFNVGMPAEPNRYKLTRPESHYVAGRNIGDEYRYILERAYTDKFPGNMLDRPELLLIPWNLRKTETAVVDGANIAIGKNKANMGSLGLGSVARELAVEPQGLKEKAEQTTNLDFLAAQSIVLTNLKPDEKGCIAIDRKSLGYSRQIHLVAADSFNTVYRQVSLAGQTLQTGELRHVQKLDPEKHFGEHKKTTSLSAGETFSLADITTSEFEIYDDLKKVYTFMMTAGEDSTLREFGFILTWPDMTADEKQEKYTKYACHELNLFLYHKDRDFFDRVVLPHLKNKKNKTFIDHWLLGNELTGYLEPWTYAQLNIAEKILLSRRNPAHSDSITRYVKDLFDMIPPDVDQNDRLFDMALRGKELDEGVAFSLEAAQYEVEDESVGSAISTTGIVNLPAGVVQKGKPKRFGINLADWDEGTKAEEKRESRLRSRQAERETSRRFFQKLDKTREWAENNYYKLPIESQNGDLIKTNAFWNDFAAHPADRPFVSKHFIHATTNFTEMMLALALLDLPFAAAEHESNIDKIAFTLKAGGPMIVFHKQIKPVEPAEQKIPIVASQNYFRSDDPYIYEGSERYDKFVKEEFLFRTAYGCRVVIGNPTSSRQKLWVLLQIPNGAIPVKSGFYSKSVPVTLEPFTTRKFEYHFYFPEAGQFSHYPAQVAKNEEFITNADHQTLNVVETFTQVNKESWDYISQQGSEQDVLHYLETHNLNRIDPEKIAFRMRDRTFFEKTIQTLRNRHFYHHTLWSYGLLHQAPAVITEFLQHSEFIDSCGAYIHTSLLSIDPVERKTYQHLEYGPLVNARTHQLGSRRKILNDRFYEQYHQFMEMLSYRDRLTDQDYLDITSYLLLQDRISEAMNFFNRIDPSRLDTRIQYDYLRLYVGFFDGDISRSRTIAAQYADYPVLKWRKMFRHALNQLDELDGQATQVADPESRDQHHGRLAATEAGFEFTIEARKVNIQYQNLNQCRVNYYPMDIELLFSRNPFVQQDTGYFSYIRPNHTQSVKLPEDQATHTFDLPEQFRNSNLMVEIVAGGVKKPTVYYANSLDVQVMENYGQIKVSHQATGKPLPITYIKTYARMRDGTIKFFKDGYTDLRGRFDYVSLNTEELNTVERFAILILNEEAGAVIREAAPPKR